MSAPQEDRELALAWRSGDAGSGERLIERYYDGIVRFFRTKTYRDQDDLVQRTFLACAESIARFRDEGSFRAFLFGIARNLLLEQIRRRARSAQRVDPDLSVRSVRDIEPGVSTIAWRREEQRLMVHALQGLPVELQLALELYYWADLSVAELAEVLELAPGTVKSRLHRARRLLREAMDSMTLPPELEKSVRSLVADWVDEVRSPPLEH